MQPIIKYSDFKDMCGYQPTCSCMFSKVRGYYLDRCPDYCYCYNPKKEPRTSEYMEKYYHDQLNELVKALQKDDQVTLDYF